MIWNKSFVIPLGFGVRQSTGAFLERATDLKAAEGCRSPRRWRAQARSQKS